MVFVQNCFSRNVQNLNSFVTFDNNYGFFTYPTVNYLFQKYKKLFSYHINAQIDQEIQTYVANSDRKFDLIHFEGNLWQSNEECLEIFRSAKLLAHPDTQFWIKDAHFISVQHAINTSVSEGIIEIKAEHFSEDIYGKRHWIEGVYK